MTDTIRRSYMSLPCSDKVKRDLMAFHEKMEQLRAEQDKLNEERNREAILQLAAEQEEEHKQTISDLEWKRSQAEADIMTEQARLDHYTARLSALDEQLATIDRSIEYYNLANNVDAEIKARNQRMKLEDKIFSLEEKVRACEKRLSKARRAKDMAEQELSASL